MKKAIIFIFSILVIVGSVLIYKHISNESARKKLENEWKKEYEEKKQQEKIALEERYKKYKTLSEIQNEYWRLEDGLTTEDKLARNLKKKFADNLLDKTMNLYVRLIDIKQIDGHRNIIMEESRLLSSYIKFHFYDDDKVIQNVNAGDKIDIVVKVEKYQFINQNNSFSSESILNVYFKIIGFENNEGDFSPFFHLDQRIK
jgi:translation initiation factor 1 (eIF-1/SUI1)